MNFLHYKIDAGPNKIIQVNLDDEANVRLLDVLNFYKYKIGKEYTSASFFDSGRSIQLVPPYKGEWHVVIDLEGKKGNLKASVEVGK